MHSPATSNGRVYSPTTALTGRSSLNAVQPTTLPSRSLLATFSADGIRNQPQPPRPNLREVPVLAILKISKKGT